MKQIKKGEVIVYALALMLVTAGYFNYINFEKKDIETGADIDEFQEENQFANVGDAVLVSNNEIEDNCSEENINNTDDKTPEVSDFNNNDLNEYKNSDQKNLTNYYANSKLERDKMYEEMITSYQNILNNLNVTENQKTIATQEITKINNTKNAIMIAENLILNKGFTNCLIFVNEENVNIVVSSENELIAEDVAKIQNIISRELGTEIINIHISQK